MFIRIIATPPGEAPEDVRQAWIGLVLPLAAGEVGPRTMLTGGVLSGPRHLLSALLHLLLGRTKSRNGYVVDAAQAVWLLGSHAPKAAAWWHDNAAHILEPGRLFMFPAWCCREEPGSGARADRQARAGPGDHAIQPPPAIRREKPSP